MTTPADASIDALPVLTRIWAELLDLGDRPIDQDTTFLRLGGDSVLAVRMAALLRKQLGVVLALSDIGVETTLNELAELVRRRVGAGGTTRALPVELRKRADPHAAFPLRPLQQGYFVGQQDGWELSYESAHFYVDVRLTDIDGDEAEDSLADALRRLAAHQPMLRARVTTEGEQHMLSQDAPGAVPVPRVYDLRDAAPGTVESVLDKVRAEMRSTGPDPVRGPGIDVRLSLLPDGDARLHTSMSLLVFDGWSSTLLFRELVALAADWNAVLPPLGMDFGDYVTSVADLPGSDEWKADRSWWWSRLDAMPEPPALPLIRDPREVRATTMETREAHLPPSRWAALRDRCAARDVTPSTALSTAFAVVLARWAGHRRMLLNSLQLNRLPLHPDVHRVVGAFSATMLLPTELTEGATFAELASAAQKRFSEYSAHNLITGVEVSRELGRRRGTHRPVAPVVFQSTLSMDAAVGEAHPESAGPLGALDFGDFHHQLRTPQVALEARVYELRSELAIVFSLVEELFETEQVDAAFTELVELVGTLADGDGWDREMDLPSPAEATGSGLLLGRYDDTDRAVAEGPLSTTLEEIVAESWEELLGVPVLDRSAQFFALGGDSLLAVRALGRLAKSFGTPVPVREFLDDPTVAGLAAALAAHGATV
ncbi:phosphopantetheine-binding protein [Amycolatopsis decaplanina]|uniref:Condensation domain-containing protein n=1 Tax=Amycolatopsis decaplanina DSM 44594 TaxID=1284240 RepID=M2Z107_9PSEU|nr:phosphopantetheine-binding protein [Amycolatopsis decaplanina]EME60942.1 condensation domain-containing protein [Amycolatopsis decaplanina DSM 44594]